MRQLIYRFASTLALIVGLLVPQAHASDVCRLPSFEGMERNKERALSVLSGTTIRDIAKAQVYVEYDGDILYYHSNFLSSGVDENGKPFGYPTKIKGSPNKNSAFAKARQVFKNIIFTSPPSEADTAILDKALQDSVVFHIDISVFDQNGRPRVDLTGIKNLRVVDGKNGRTITTPESLTTLKPPPSLISKIKGCCLYGRPPHFSQKFSDALSKQEINPNRVKFASLFIDSATEEAVLGSPLVRSSRIPGDGRKLNSRTDFDKLMVAAKGSTLILVGHVEGSDYVVRDSGNRENFRISIADARQVAKVNNVRLVDIGCETVNAIESESMGFGVITKYNSVDAVKSLNRALTDAKTFEDFLVSLSSEGLKVVVEQSFVDQPDQMQASVYSRIRDSTKQAWMKLATVTFSGFGR